MPNNVSLKFNLDVDNGNGIFDRHKKDISDSLVKHSLQVDARQLATCQSASDINTPYGDKVRANS